MNRFFKAAFLFFASISIPLSVYFSVSILIFESGCDPKFGCKTSFQITMAVLAIPTLMATVSALFGLLIFKVYSFRLKVGAVIFGFFSLPVVILTSKIVGSNVIELVILAAYFLIGPLFIFNVVSKNDGR